MAYKIPTGYLEENGITKNYSLLPPSFLPHKSWIRFEVQSLSWCEILFLEKVGWKIQKHPADCLPRWLCRVSEKAGTKIVQMVFQLHTRSTFNFRKLSYSFEVLNQYSCSPSMKDWFWSLMRRIKFELIMQSVVLLRWSSRRDLPAAYSQVLPTDLLILTNISSTLNTLAGKLSACCT